jgi:hypothetical protein
VEISSHYPYYPTKLFTEGEEQTTSSQKASGNFEAKGAGGVGVEVEDRLELVRAQNLASPPQEPVDLSRAAELLRQVQDQMHILGKQEAGELYEVDRLRDLAYRISQADKG